MIKKYTLSFLLLFLSFIGYAQNGPDCPEVCYGPGGPLVLSGSLTISSNTFYSSITVNNKATLTVKSGSTLYIGHVGTPNTTQVVDFQNGCVVVIEAGASLVVNGLLNNSNNSDGVIFNGSVAVTGNVTGGNGSVIVGTGTLEATGSIVTSNSGSIFGSTDDCTTGPCFSSSTCSGATNYISGNQTICSGNVPATLSGSNVNSATYQWQYSTTFGANFTDISGATLQDYSPGALITTTYYRRKLKLSSGCTMISSSVKVLVNPAPAKPTASATFQPTCSVPTGTITVTSTTGINYSIDGSTYVNTNGIFTSVAPGTYNVTAKNSSGCISSATSVTILSPTNTWKIISGVAQWDNGTPNINQSIIFEANYNRNVNLEGCSCEVKSGTVTIKGGRTLTLTNELKVSGGTMKFENNASLVQINEDPTINSGNITYQRETVTPIDKFDFTYWSSPVSPQTLYDVSPNTLFDKYMSFDAVTNNWIIENSSKVMELGVGYSIRGPQNYYAPNPIGTYRANFIGVPHNGTISVPITATDASYLLGNPYASALDATAFLTENAGVLDGTIYFWTHNTDIVPSGSLYIYSSDDYATYNLTGGVGTVADSDPDKTITNPHKPTGKTASGQGFFAASKTIITGVNEVVYKNSMRVGVDGITGDNSQFFRAKNIKSKVATMIKKNRVWLNLTNTEGAFKQILVGYVTGATNEYDTSYDGFSLNLNKFINFYSIVDNEAMVIQGRALPFDESDVVPLGYSSTIVGGFSISIDEVDGMMKSQNVFLEDKMLNVIHNLKALPYTFTTQKGTFDDRFVLRYTDKTLGTDDFDKIDRQVVVSKDKNELKIISAVEIIKRITVFDLLGKKVFEKDAVDNNEFRSSSIGLNKQTGIVKITLANGKVISKKVIF